MNRTFIRYALVTLVLFALLFFLFRFRIHLQPIWAYIATVNSVGFVMYALDKFFAKRSWLRIPESLLHLLAFAGATPAAILAQQLFWHKTTKRSFQITFWMIVLLQLSIVYIAVFTDLLQTIF
ncbi:MAG: DUF1294 domain-containing protein [Helicobacteraceae bacterium]|nr:DUF1294 domain-containing protein [Helicobacteraceae bacterium]